MAHSASASEVRGFIIQNVEEHPNDIAKFAAEHFGVSRQAIHRHLKSLVADGVLREQGRTRTKTYELKFRFVMRDLCIEENRDEDKVWRELAAPLFAGLPDNVQTLCYYGFTEMYNNAVDHSEGDKIELMLKLTAKDARINIKDNGIGIFEKIKSRCNLLDHRQAILELSKGKLTTDPAHHSGEGIFFTSRAFDAFFITANELDFGHTAKADDWLFDSVVELDGGTDVGMEIAINSPRTLKSVFDQFTGAADEDFGFSRTHVPLTLARFGNENLISRSQARRVLARVDRFKEVILDFEGVEMIGQGFADEVFRVFQTQHPEIKLVPLHANADVQKMIMHVLIEAEIRRRADEAEQAAAEHAKPSE